LRVWLSVYVDEAPKHKGQNNANPMPRFSGWLDWKISAIGKIFSISKKAFYIILKDQFY